MLCSDLQAEQLWCRWQGDMRIHTLAQCFKEERLRETGQEPETRWTPLNMRWPGHSSSLKGRWGESQNKAGKPGRCLTSTLQELSLYKSQKQEYKWWPKKELRKFSIYNLKSGVFSALCGTDWVHSSVCEATSGCNYFLTLLNYKRGHSHSNIF